MLLYRSREQRTRICRIDRKRDDLSHRTRISVDDLIGVIRTHANTADRRSDGPNQLPGIAVIRAAPQRLRPGIKSVRIERIEGEKPHRAAQIKHPPRTAAVMTDVGTRHIAGNQHLIRVMRADRCVEHRSSAPWADYGKVFGMRPQGGETDDGDQTKRGY